MYENEKKEGQEKRITEVKSLEREMKMYECKLRIQKLYVNNPKSCRARRMVFKLIGRGQMDTDP